jgi:hypothetical protein
MLLSRKTLTSENHHLYYYTTTMVPQLSSGGGMGFKPSRISPTLLVHLHLYHLQQDHPRLFMIGLLLLRSANKPRVPRPGMLQVELELQRWWSQRTKYSGMKVMS